VPGIWGDPDRLLQVAWNLLTNAVKFTPAGGSIRVAVTEDAQQVQVAVSDTGVGIDPAFIGHLFERFRQADPGAPRSRGGLGLGLSISKKLMLLHQGDIRADSAGPGCGTTFTVPLPRVQRPGVAAPRSSWGELEDDLLSTADAARLLERRRILVVDDDEESCAMVERLLTQYGAIVTTANDPKLALRDLRKTNPALIVCDIGMPALNGYEFLRRVHLHGSVPAIAFTAFAREQDRQLALDAGFVAHLAKPAPPSALVALCSEVLAGGR
jgi:CheY-like chemotaxis protein